ALVECERAGQDDVRLTHARRLLAEINQRLEEQKGTGMKRWGATWVSAVAYRHYVSRYRQGIARVARLEEQIRQIDARRRNQRGNVYEGIHAGDSGKVQRSKRAAASTADELAAATLRLKEAVAAVPYP